MVVKKRLSLFRGKGLRVVPFKFQGGRGAVSLPGAGNLHF